MKRFRVELTRTAERQLRKLDREVQVRLVCAMAALALDPRPAECRKLRGLSDVYRVRAGAYRVVYRVEDERVVVVVLKLGHRREIYR